MPDKRPIARKMTTAIVFGGKDSVAYKTGQILVFDKAADIPPAVLINSEALPEFVGIPHDATHFDPEWFALATGPRPPEPVAPKPLFEEDVMREMNWNREMFTLAVRAGFPQPTGYALSGRSWWSRAALDSYRQAQAVLHKAEKSAWAR
jgi:hypothetical protein